MHQPMFSLLSLELELENVRFPDSNNWLCNNSSSFGPASGTLVTGHLSALANLHHGVPGNLSSPQPIMDDHSSINRP